MTTHDNKSKILIKGVTHEGKTFRPSDWAERMSCSLATFRGQRIQYDPRLVPVTDESGEKCLLVDPTLKDTDPELYQSILDFAAQNNLPLCKED